MKYRKRIILAIIVTAVLLGSLAFYGNQILRTQYHVPSTPTVATTTVTSDLLPREDIARITGAVADMYGKPFKKEVEVNYLDKEQLSDYIHTISSIEFPEEETTAARDVWALWGVVDEDLDLEGIYLNLFSQGLAGLYDDRSEKMYLIEGDFSKATQEMTLAHELTHALEDQWFDFSATTDDLEVHEEDDNMLAYAALAEGSAMRIMETYGMGLSNMTKLLSLTDALSADTLTATAVMNNLPTIVQQQMLFPYEGGYRFLKAYFDAHPESSMEEIYAHPPTSTAEILHPELYPRLVPASILFPSFASDTLQDEGVLGEWQLRQVLDNTLTTAEAEQAAAGWINDRYVLLKRNNHKVLFSISDWASEQDAEEFETALRSYLTQRFGTSETGTNTTVETYGNARSFSLRRVGNRTLFLLGNDRAMVLTFTPALTE